MDAAIPSNNFLPPSNAQPSLHAQLASLYSDLQSRHKAQKIEMIEYKHKANYWEAQFTQLKTREVELTNEVEELKAKLRKREQQLFGKKSEKNTSPPEKNPNATTQTEKPKKSAGNNLAVLAVADETIVICQQQKKW